MARVFRSCGPSMQAYNKRQYLGLLLGPVLFFLLLAIPAPASMPPSGMAVAAVTSLMAVWWICEAIPIPATALLPIALFPLLGVVSAAKVTAAYADHLIFLFMGGFLIAVTMERWQLHKRIALHTIRIIGATPRRIILGFMMATAFLSMWISNTATAMMMVTIGIAVLGQITTLVEPQGKAMAEGHQQFGTALMLGIAYASSIGGVATLIGTPPNAILAGVVEKNYGITIGFAQWMAFALPLSLVMLGLTWFYLTRLGFKIDHEEIAGGRIAIEQEFKKLGRITKQERRVLIVFLAVAVAWLLRGLINMKSLSMVSDSTIAIIGGLLLFIIPSDLKKAEFLLDWPTAVKIPWDIMLLFGGGFALANAFQVSGLTEWLAGQLNVLQGVNVVLMIATIVTLVIFLTEVTSNTATASLLLPVMGALAQAMQTSPLGLMTAVAITASFAFMLPVATPPNAIVFGSRQVTIPQMARTGFWLNIMGILLITFFITVVMPMVWDMGLLKK
jgi:sodium-dependent dicarboxylate transporter 2/3/5